MITKKQCSFFLGFALSINFILQASQESEAVQIKILQQSQARLQGAHEKLEKQHALLRESSCQLQKTEDLLHLWKQNKQLEQEIAAMERQSLAVQVQADQVLKIRKDLQVLLAVDAEICAQSSRENFSRTQLRDWARRLSSVNSENKELLNIAARVRKDLRRRSLCSLTPACFHRKTIDNLGKDLNAAVTSSLEGFNSSPSHSFGLPLASEVVAQAVIPSAPGFVQDYEDQVYTACSVYSLNQDPLGGYKIQERKLK